jgi:hypothetical protein
VKLRIGDVIALASLVVVILIVVIIVARLQIVANTLKVTGMSVEANDTIDLVFSNAWTGLTLAALGIIIAAAVGILALVMSALGGATGGVG